METILFLFVLQLHNMRHMYGRVEATRGMEVADWDGGVSCMVLESIWSCSLLFVGLGHVFSI